MFWHDGEIHQVMVGKVFHVVGVSHGTIVHLSLAYYFYRVVIMEGRRSTHYIHHLAVALVGMQSGSGTGTECGIHDLYLVVYVVARVKFALAALEVQNVGFLYLLKIYQHNSCLIFFRDIRKLC